jgi:hypothetical protein
LEFTNNPINENLLYFDAGVDGLFTEHPHLTMAVFRDEHAAA